MPTDAKSIELRDIEDNEPLLASDINPLLTNTAEDADQADASGRKPTSEDVSVVLTPGNSERAPRSCTIYEHLL